MKTLRERTGGSILKPGAWEHDVYDKLAAGDAAGALAVMNQGLPPSFPPGHYQANIPYALVMESFDAMVSDDAGRGKKVASAVATYAELVEPALDSLLGRAAQRRRLAGEGRRARHRQMDGRPGHARPDRQPPHRLRLRFRLQLHDRRPARAGARG